MGIPYTGSGVSACIRAADKVLAKHAMRDRGIPTPDFYSFSETAFEALGAAQALPAIEDRLEFPIVVKPAAQGSALGIKFARTPADVPQALVAAFSYDRKVLLERHVAGRDLAVSILDEDGGVGPRSAASAADRRGGPAAGGLLRLRVALRDRAHEVRLPGGARRTSVAARASELALEVYALLGCRGFARVDLMLDASGERAVRARGRHDPRADRDEPAAAGGRRRRDRVRRADRRRVLAARGAGPLLRPPRSPPGVTWSRKSLNFSTTSSVSSTSCSNSIADSAITSSAAKIGAPARTASASASLGRESISSSRPLTRRLIEA